MNKEGTYSGPGQSMYYEYPLHVAVMSVPAQAEGISVGCWAMFIEQTYAQRNSPQLPKTSVHVQFTSPIGKPYICLTSSSF